ncbi:MAG: ATP-binding protein [Candidatus Hydrogenedentes bacterium]|nr:ATP-binding protein [Candidatus Hydrogenedentota bacterium]
MHLEFAAEPSLLAVLRQVNPWWSGKPVPDLPETPRDILAAVQHGLSQAQPTLTVLSGLRKVGKSALLAQTAQEIVYGGVAPEQLLYVPFDHPVFRLAGVARVVEAWMHVVLGQASSAYLLLDEVQLAEDWPAWLESGRAALPGRHYIVAAQSVRPKPAAGAQAEGGGDEAGLIRIAPLTFHEYLGVRGLLEDLRLPEMGSLRELTGWTPARFEQAAAQAERAVALFNEYLLQGGFPDTASMDDAGSAQRRLMEDVVERAIRCEAASVYGVRRLGELERLFAYLCMHDAAVLDVQGLAEALGISKNTVRSHLDVLEAAHLIQRLPQFGYGAEVLRGRVKVHLAAPALGLGLLLRGREALEDGERTAAAVETAVLNHLTARYPTGGPEFSYWRGKPGEEVSVVASGGAQSRPFLVRYTQHPGDQAALKGLRRFCRDKSVRLAYVITRNPSDFGPLTLTAPERGSTDALPTRCLMVPALLFCYWMGRPSLPEPTEQRAGWFKGLRG